MIKYYFNVGMLDGLLRSFFLTDSIDVGIYSHSGVVPHNVTRVLTANQTMDGQDSINIYLP